VNPLGPPEPTPEARAEAARREHERAADAVAFHRLFLGEGSGADATRVLAWLERYVDAEPDPSRNTDQQAWHYAGQRHLLRMIREQRTRGAKLDARHAS